MRYFLILFLLSPLLCPAEEPLFDSDYISSTANLEITVLQDWQPASRAPSVRQKLIEITVCEWWPGQKVRLPVTLNAPADGRICTNVIVANQPLSKRAFLPKGNLLRLLKEDGVGVVLVGMGTIDAMPPEGQLHLGMQKQLLATRSTRYTPAWIWGMSQMRALSAALSEPDVFRPRKVLTTGGSKRGIAAAVAGIHDPRFTAFLPVVAPPMGNPGTASHVIGTEPQQLQEIDRSFLNHLDDPKAVAALQARAQRRAANRITLEAAKAAEWTDLEIREITNRAWNASRITHHLKQTSERGLEVFYNVGTNDSVTPSLLELGKRFPDFPICIIPGGQHGGPADAGFTRRTPLLPEIQSNLLSFARIHFFRKRSMCPAPKITGSFDRQQNIFQVKAYFADGVIPEKNELWWNLDRSEPYTLPFEYDTWNSVAMTGEAPGILSAEIQLEEIPHRLDYLSLHTHTENQLPLTISSPYRRLKFDSAVVALIGDSTVTDRAGWGKAFADSFSDRVTVHNFAMGGRSSKSWLAEGRLPTVREAMPDYLLIQFGHNGQPGKGPHRETDPATTYREYLKIYIEEALAIGATPILLSPVTRRDFTAEDRIRLTPAPEGQPGTRPLKPRAEAVKAVAQETGIAFIDLYRLSVDLHNDIGPAASHAFSPKEGDITHFNEQGAEAIANLIVGELRKVAPNLAALLEKP